MRNLYFILLLFLSACQLGVPKFPKEETLSAELMPLEGTTFPLRLEIKHPYLVLQNLKLQDSIFHIYDLRDNKLKSAFGQIGEGPQEFVVPWLIQNQFADLLIEDRHIIHRFQINEKGEAIFKGTREPNYISQVSNAVFVNDTTFIVDAMYTAPDLYLLNFGSDLPEKTWTYRNSYIVDYYADPNMGNVYANENRIVFCYGYKKQIDFMDTEFKLIKRVKFRFDNPTQVNSSNQGDVPMSYVYAYLGKRYLYALFLGTSWNENRANSTCGTYLEVYDLDGNPVIRYHLKDRRPVYYVVDETNYTLYGAGEEGEPEDNLLVYKLKGLL